MSNIKKVFIDSSDGSELEVCCTGLGIGKKISLSIKDDTGVNYVHLDISTAIAFAKEIRKEINKAKGQSIF